MNTITFILVGIIGYIAYIYGKHNKEEEHKLKNKIEFNSNKIDSYKLLDLVEVIEHIGSTPPSTINQNFGFSFEKETEEIRYYRNIPDLRIGYKGIVVKKTNEYDIHNNRKVQLYIFPLRDYWVHRVKQYSSKNWDIDIYHKKGELAFGQIVFDLRKIKKITTGFEHDKEDIIRYLHNGYKSIKYFGEEFDLELERKLREFLGEIKKPIFITKKRRFNSLNQVERYFWTENDKTEFDAVPFNSFEDTNETGIYLANGHEITIQEILTAICDSLPKSQLPSYGISIKGRIITIKDTANLLKFAIGRKRRKEKIIGFAYAIC